MTISNHIPNRYVLSFQAQSPHTGFHAIELRVPRYAGFKVAARNGYWADSANPSRELAFHRTKHPIHIGP